MPQPNVMRIGAIGADSSHLPEFSKRIKALHEEGQTRCRVTHVFDPGGHDLAEAPKWLEKTTSEYGVEQVGSLDELLARVDGVMVLSVNGHKHLDLARPSLGRGLPTYVDKPLTCDLGQARQLLAAARQGGARSYSASSLRFAQEVTDYDRASLGNLVAIDAFGPGQLHALMEGLFFYGVHTIEMVDALWGKAGGGGGVRRVSAIHLPDRDLLDLEYRNGRYARLRMERKGSYEFGGTVHGDKKLYQFKVDFGPVYLRLVQGMTRFFEGGPAPAELRDIVENVAVMEAGNASMKQDGKWVDVPVIE